MKKRRRFSENTQATLPVMEEPNTGRQLLPEAAGAYAEDSQLHALVRQSTFQAPLALLPCDYHAISYRHSINNTSLS